MSSESGPVVIDLAILGLLKNQDLHGYELRKRLGDLPGSGTRVSFGSLYPALARLERAGSVKAVRPPGAGHPASPMTGALSGEIAAFRTRSRADDQRPQDHHESRESGRRAKKVFGITEVGERRLVDLLLDESGDERTFELRVAFCRNLAPAERTAMFERRRRQLVDRIEAIGRRAAEATTDLYLRSLEEHDLTTLTSDLAWVDRLLDATRPAPDTNGDLATTTGGTRR